MKEAKRMRLIHRQQLEDVPELVQHIQSLLPAKDAARTCILSKSWLHAWSTIPTLRLCRSAKSFSKQQERRYMRLIRRTIRRYHQNNIPIITCDLHFAIHKQKSATRVEKWLKSVASKSCLKELRLTIFDDIASFTLPDEIFSSENLNTLSIKLAYPLHIEFPKKNHSLHISRNPLIDCMNLRVLELLEVHISEEALHNLLSTCKLLENINIKFTEGLKKYKVNNLRYLQQLKIAPGNYDGMFEIYNVEIYDVPSLRSFYYDAAMLLRDRPVLFKMDLIRSLRELYLMNVYFNDAFSDMIKSKFPFLESLTLKIKHCKVGIMDINCATLQRLEIQSPREIPIKVQVNAPKLLFFVYESASMPSLLFQTMAPEQIELSLSLNNPIDHLLFLKIWETLNLSSKFNIEIKNYELAGLVPFNIDDVRTRVPFPATNVETLSFESFSSDGLWDNLLLFDAFFSICQPMYVRAEGQLRLKVATYFLKLITRAVRKSKTGKVSGQHLKYGEIRNGCYEKWEKLTGASLSMLDDGKWEKLTSASLSMLDGTLPLVGYFSEFKLTWGCP